MLASAVVTNTYPLLGHFRYVTIAPITLAPGTYEVAGVSFGDNYTWNDPGFSTDPSITYLPFSDVWQQISTPDFLPAGTNTSSEAESDGFWGPNLFLGAPTFTTSVPEPSSLALLGISLLGLGLVATRRRWEQAKLSA